jgi:hypothetical protein
MPENVLIALQRKRGAGTFNSDSVWDSRARKELASNWSDYVEPGKDFDDSVAELRESNLISTGLCDQHRLVTSFNALEHLLFVNNRRRNRRKNRPRPPTPMPTPLVRKPN